MHIKYLIFSLLLITSFVYLPDIYDKDDLIKQEIEVEVIDNDQIKTYTTTLGIKVKDFLDENNLEANGDLNCNYTLTDKDIINISGDNKQSINNISLNDLKEIPYISDNNAISIIEYRNSNGYFKSFDEIKNVKGIGDSKLKILKEYLTL